MNRENIKQYLNKMSLPKEEYIILAGASLVMHGVKENTHDIDISVSETLEQYLLQHYDFEFEIVQNGKNVYTIDNVLSFSTNLFDTDKITCDDFQIQSLESIIQLKRKLNRDKDKKDIEIIEQYIRGKL